MIAEVESKLFSINMFPYILNLNLSIGVRSGVDDSQVAIKKPYQPALTFLSQEQFDDNDGMYENKFKHRSR